MKGILPFDIGCYLLFLEWKYYFDNKRYNMSLFDSVFQILIDKVELRNNLAKPNSK